jgi:hypothetical protein
MCAVFKLITFAEESRVEKLNENYLTNEALKLTPYSK